LGWRRSGGRFAFGFELGAVAAATLDVLVDLLQAGRDKQSDAERDEMEKHDERLRCEVVLSCKVVRL
jgi:hypothetical protein